MAVLTSVLDASILYSPALRDLVLSLAAEGLYSPIWSSMIHDEWTQKFIADHPARPAISAYVSSTRQQMDTVFPVALVDGFQSLILGLTLPDADDRHVLALAIHAGAQLIVTKNVRDFPSAQLFKFGIEAWAPDQFVAHSLTIDVGGSLGAIRTLRARLRNPPMTQAEYVNMIKNKLQMPQTAQILQSLTPHF